jgi:hypothetical protein
MRSGLGTDVARSTSLVIVMVAATAFAIGLLLIARGQWFVTDEFDYVLPSDEPLLGWLLRPHNEHTIAFTKVWFGLLSTTIGLRHYVIYIVPLVVAHLVCVAAIYRLTWIATASRTVATGIALMALAMGAAAGTLTWAGQFQYIGSVAAGMLVLLLAVESPRRWSVPVLIGITLFGTLNGTAFVAFALTAAVAFALRRRWPEALIVAAIPVAWQVLVRVVWSTPAADGAHSLDQILRDGPVFVFAILDTAISQTIREPHMTAAILTALIGGALVLFSAAPASRRTSATGRVLGALVLASVLSMFILVIGRLSRGPDLSSGGGYSYLILVTLFPLAGVLLGHATRSRAALVGVSGALVIVAMMGLVTLSDNVTDLSKWKLDGAHLMQTAAAQLVRGIPTYREQIPVPETGPTVSQAELGSWTKAGQLDAAVIGQAEADQVSLNMQWHMTEAPGVAGDCRDVAAGDRALISEGVNPVLIALQPGATADLRYPDSGASRTLNVPDVAMRLESLSQRPAVLSVRAGAVRVCVPG